MNKPKLREAFYVVAATITITQAVFEGLRRLRDSKNMNLPPWVGDAVDWWRAFNLPEQLLMGVGTAAIIWLLLRALAWGLSSFGGGADGAEDGGAADTPGTVEETTETGAAVLEQLGNGDGADPDAHANEGRKRPATAQGTRRPSTRRGSKVAVTLDVASLRQFVGTKRPKNHEQRAAVIAAYFSLDEVSRIGGEHIRRAYAALECKRPRNIAQVLCNAHIGKGWFTAAGRDGLRELTETGRDFVERLPEP